ncbi:MAG: hypothetical protein Q7R66_14355 [Undibacterium sp.]|uniref:hypothetical protein n=1 Tax=Undibacterium sp. TaxID=1914977 RepID=UPI00272740CD|nr:hypothetical protein [Undibacterium sp.]MDO8653364.1 hypothetical protein [Undibacterium sp.]
MIIDSTLEIPGAIPIIAGVDANGEEVDITIRMGELPSELNIEKHLEPYSWSPGQIVFDMPSVARYLCERGVAIIIEPAAGAEKRAIEEMLIATALPVLLWMRDQIILHASCLIPVGLTASIAISGPSGIGKSTLLEQFYARGAKVVGDDTILLCLNNGVAVASGLPCSIQARTANSATRHEMFVAKERTLASSPLAALFLLTRTPTQSSNQSPFVELKGAEAILAILAQRHRARVLSLLGKEATVFKTITSILSQKTFKIFAWYRREGDVVLGDREVEFMTALCTATNKPI